MLPELSERRITVALLVVNELGKTRITLNAVVLVTTKIFLTISGHKGILIEIRRLELIGGLSLCRIRFEAMEELVIG